MSDETVIKVANLSKYYDLKRTAPPDLLREQISTSLAQLWQPNQKHAPHYVPPFPALRAINLEITRGEIVGIIGKNGVGKSTLLRLLSRVTQPSEGDIYLVGKVAALLEVGLGFHPDLTGRENVYLGGALLGLDRNTINARLPEISAFADIGHFLDQAVKKYSSGMYVRLAFAIAAHLDADILLIDEVLAVGDAAFQKKCLQKIQDINRQGTTILIVSHNLSAIEWLCQRCLVLNAGQIAFDGNPHDAILFYREKILGIEPRSTYQRRGNAPANQVSAYLQSASIYDLHQNPIQKLPAGAGCVIQLQIRNLNQQLQPLCTLYLRNCEGQIIARLAPQDTGFVPQHSFPDLNLYCTIPCLNLVPNPYTIDVHIYAQNQTLEYLDSILRIEITEPTQIPLISGIDSRYRGFILLEQHWAVTD